MKDLKLQIPAVGIMKTSDWGNSKMYKIQCTCGNDDDNIEFMVEADDLNMITVTTFTTQKTAYWDRPFDVSNTYKIKNSFLSSIAYETLSFLNGFQHRIKMTWNLWFNGYLKYQQSTIMTEQQTLNYAETLNAAIKDCQEFRKRHDEKN
jgi:hypothetical protein